MRNLTRAPEREALVIAVVLGHHATGLDSDRKEALLKAPLLDSYLGMLPGVLRVRGVSEVPADLVGGAGVDFGATRLPDALDVPDGGQRLGFRPRASYTV